MYIMDFNPATTKIYSSYIKKMCFLNFRSLADKIKARILPEEIVNKVMLYALQPHPCAVAIAHISPDEWCWECEGKCQADETETCVVCGA